MKPPIPQLLYGTAWKEDRTASLVELAIRSGFRGIDTANQRKHYFESAVGEGLRACYDAGIVTRDQLLLQTKFTYQRGQDHRLPYDPAASLSDQVKQSLASSLTHLDTECVDSFVLHGPSSGHDWTTHDVEVWQAMISERDVGRTRMLGVSNISLRQLQQLAASHAEQPSFVQNRCFARLGWDREVRTFCREHAIIYQGFSLLTANQELASNPELNRISSSHQATLAQTIFAFSHAVGMLPLTGTSSADHMQEDLASTAIVLTQKETDMIESIAG